MDEIEKGKKIRSKIERHIEEGNLEMGGVVKIKNLTPNEFNFLRSYYMGKEEYSLEDNKSNLFIDAKNLGDTYTLELKYLGEKQ